MQFHLKSSIFSLELDGTKIQTLQHIKQNKQYEYGTKISPTYQVLEIKYNFSCILNSTPLSNLSSSSEFFRANPNPSSSEFFRANPSPSSNEFFRANPSPNLARLVCHPYSHIFRHMHPTHSLTKDILPFKEASI